MHTKNIKTMRQPEIGRLIRALRTELGLTQQQMSNELLVVTSTVNRWEMGRSQPSPMALGLIETKLVELGKRGEELLEKHLSK